MSGDELSLRGLGAIQETAWRGSLGGLRLHAEAMEWKNGTVGQRESGTVGQRER